MTYMEIVSLTLELSGGVNLVGHDPGDGLFHILHPFGHLGVPHVIDLLDEGIIFLPESHLGCLLDLYKWDHECSKPYSNTIRA